MKSKIMILFFWVFLAVFNCIADESAFFKKGQPLFDSASKTGKIVSVINEDGVLNYQEKKETIFYYGALYKRYTFYRMNINGNVLWACTDIIQDQAGQPFFDEAIVWPLNIAVILGLAGLGVYLLFFMRLRQKDRREFFNHYKIPALLGFLLLLHFVYLFWLLFQADGFHRYPLDEESYFHFAKCLLSGDFKTPYTMTIGYSIYMIPYIMLTNAQTVYDIAPMLCYVMSCVFMPLILCMIFYIINKLTRSPWKAFFSILLYMVISRCFFAVEITKPLDLFSPFGISHSKYIFTCYSYVLQGFLSMSCGFAFFLCTLIIFLCFYLKPTMMKYLLISVMFGFCCLVRMNYLVMAPLIAYIFWLHDRERLTDYRYLIKTVGICFLMFTAIFSGQFIINYIQQGNFFANPYNFHSEPVRNARGIKYFSDMAEYYFRIHNLWYALAIPSFFLMKNRQLRNILILWAIPLTLFFFMINFTGHPYRFMLMAYPAFAIAFVCSGLWNIDCSVLRRILFSALILLLVLPVLPFDFNFFENSSISNSFFNTWLYIRMYLAIPLWLAALFYFRKNLPIAIFVLFFGILINNHSKWIMVGSMITLVLYAIYDLVKDFCMAVRERKKNVG